jgi:thiosulfate reductase cytochrome b subunit
VDIARFYDTVIGVSLASFAFTASLNGSTHRARLRAGTTTDQSILSVRMEHTAPPLTVPADVESTSQRHRLFVRVTHWIQAVGFVVLLLSGIAILLAHPRLYWGETGALGSPSLVDLPLPFVLDVPIRGPGRYLHFLAAWMSVFTGFIYVVMGLATRHFTTDLLPKRGQFTSSAIASVISNHLHFKRSTEEELASYNILQRLSYSTVVFVLFPLIVWTGLGMSPAATSVFPFLATTFGGQQSARTIHFFAAVALTMFVVVHIALVWQTGFKRRVRDMITGNGKERTT